MNNNISQISTTSIPNSFKDSSSPLRETNEPSSDIHPETISHTISLLMADAHAELKHHNISQAWKTVNIAQSIALRESSQLAIRQIDKELKLMQTQLLSRKAKKK